MVGAVSHQTRSNEMLHILVLLFITSSNCHLTFHNALVYMSTSKIW